MFYYLFFSNYLFLGFLGCPIDQATCRNEKCISRSSICNGRDDCGDNSDEFNCGTDVRKSGSKFMS